MSATGVSKWVKRYGSIFDELGLAVEANAEANGAVGRAAEAESEPELSEALSLVGSTAGSLLRLARRGTDLPKIPDPTTEAAWSAALRRWIDGCETLAEAAPARDVDEIHRAARAIDAGSDEFLRMAAAMRRATGQPPDPNNPMS